VRSGAGSDPGAVLVVVPLRRKNVLVIVPLLYKVIRKLLSVPSVVLRSERAKDAELLMLRHENAIL
jgi:hypothetical protein